MQPWDRLDTKEYWAYQEFLVEELLNHKKKTLQFCDDNNIENPTTVIACLLMSAAWVYAQYGEKCTVGLTEDYLGGKRKPGEQVKERPADFEITISKTLAKHSHTEMLVAVWEACTS